MHIGAPEQPVTRWCLSVVSMIDVVYTLHGRDTHAPVSCVASAKQGIEVKGNDQHREKDHLFNREPAGLTLLFIQLTLVCVATVYSLVEGAWRTRHQRFNNTARLT